MKYEKSIFQKRFLVSASSTHSCLCLFERVLLACLLVVACGQLQRVRLKQPLRFELRLRVAGFMGSRSGRGLHRETPITILLAYGTSHLAPVMVIGAHRLWRVRARCANEKELIACGAHASVMPGLRREHPLLPEPEGARARNAHPAAANLPCTAGGSTHLQRKP